MTASSARLSVPSLCCLYDYAQLASANYPVEASHHCPIEWRSLLAGATVLSIDTALGLENPPPAPQLPQCGSIYPLLNDANLASLFVRLLSCVSSSLCLLLTTQSRQFSFPFSLLHIILDFILSPFALLNQLVNQQLMSCNDSGQCILGRIGFLG